MIGTATYERRTFRVQAIQVTKENLEELAAWTGGEISNTPNKFIVIPVHRRNTTRAYVGDWITRLGAGSNFRVYACSVFLEGFRQVHDEQQKYAEIHQIIVNAMRKQDVATYHGESSKGMDIVADKATRNILGLF